MGKGSGGGSPAPTNQTVTQTNLPAWAQPYSEQLLGKTQALTDINQNPYQQYGGQMVADFTPMQQQAFSNIGGMQTAPQLGQGSDLAAASGLGSIQAGQQYGQQATDPSAVSRYMNPYLQNTLNPAMQLLNQQYGIAGQQGQGAATKGGAFGGNRATLANSLNQQNQMLAQNQLVGGAYNQAYNTANQNMQAAAGQALQGYGQANTAAGTLGQLGQSQYNQQMGINQAQQGVGAQQQAMNQQNLTNQYQNFLNQQNYPYKQLGFMSDILHGTPTGGTTLAQSTAAPPNMMGQIAGLGLGVGSLLTGASNAGIGKASNKEGGVIKGYKKGGAVQHFDEGGITSLLTDPSTELAAKMPPNRPPITTAEALAKFMLPVIQKMHQPITKPGTTTVAEDMAREILDRKQHQQMAQAPEQQQPPPQQMAMQEQMPQEQMPQEQQMQNMASGGLASLPAANFNDDSFVGGGIIAFADEGEVPEPKGDEKPKSDDKPKRVRGKKGAAPVAPVEATPKSPAQIAAEADAEFRARQGAPAPAPAPAASTAAPTKSPAQVAAEADAEFRARQGVASGQSAEPQSRFSKIRGALQPKLLNPNVTASGEGILSGLGKVAKYAGKSVGPLAALDMGKTALDLANTPTDVIRQYYGNNEEPSFLGDVGIRSRAALGSLMPFSDTAEGLRALQQKQNQATAPVVPETTPEKDKSGLTADQRAAAIIASIGGGGGGGGGGGRAGAGGAGAGNAVANTGLSPELKLIMENRKADRDAREAEVKANAPKGLEDYIKAEKNIYAKEGIGNAAKEEKERLDARLAGMQGEQKAAFLRDLSKAGFAMAQNASQHGATFLGSAAAGGMNFSESNAKTAEHFANLSETLASNKAKLAQADEAVRAGMIAKGSAEHKEAQKEYATARNKVMELNEKMSEADLSAYRALEVMKLQGRNQLENTRLHGAYQLQAAQMGIAGKENVEKQLGAAYLAAMKKSPPDNAAAQAILKRIQDYRIANTTRDPARKALTAVDLQNGLMNLKRAIDKKDPVGIATWSEYLGMEPPSAAGAGAGSSVMSAADRILAGK